MENSKFISMEKLKEYNDYYKNNKMSRMATKAMCKTAIDDVCYDQESNKKMNHKFSVDIPTLPAANQKSSGRCWIFSALNIMREKIAKDLNLSKFELSQNFISFYDHLEKSNAFLEKIIETMDKPLDDRIVHDIMQSPVSDGGWWDMFVGLCQKYGVVPKEAMPETFQSSNTAAMNNLLKTKLREDAVVIRKAFADNKDISEIREMKMDMLKDIYNIIAICLGNPPEKFDFEYVDKNKEYHLVKDLTPHEFYDKYVGEDLDDIVTLSNTPTSNKPLNKMLLLTGSASVIEGKPIKFLNIAMDELKEAVIKQLQDGEPVWFTCDSKKFINRPEGVWNIDMYDYETPFSVTFNMEKGDRLDYYQSLPAHAMVLTGVNLADGKPDKWKVENSWGTDKGNSGYFIISDEWFNEYVYVACVHKKYLTESQLSILSEEPIILPPWDVMS